MDSFIKKQNIFVKKQNVDRFRKLAAETTDAAERERILNLLAEEEAKRSATGS